MAELLDRYRNLITIGLAALVAAAVVAFVLDQRDSTQPLTINLADPPASGPIEVYITGAVTEPGVYEMSDGDRIIDLLYEAGGHTPDADLDSINLALRLHDEKIELSQLDSPVDVPLSLIQQLCSESGQDRCVDG